MILPVDGVFSEKQMRLLTEPLYSSWTCPAGQQSFVAMANVGLFFAVDRPAHVPDVLLSTNVVRPADFRPKRHRSYFTWLYGKSPDVVIEVVSNREGGEDTDKLAAYAEVGVRDYAIFDPDRLLGPELLRVYRLVEGEGYLRDGWSRSGLRSSDWDFVSGRASMRLGRCWLRWVDAEGMPIPTGNERAKSEQRRADVEQQRADAERQRADRLAEQLRQMGVDPAK